MQKDILRCPGWLSAVAGLSLAAVAGCATYSPGQLSAMSAADLCELQNMQGSNLSAATRQTIQSELQRRNDNCGNHAGEVARRYQAFMDRETYGKQDDP